MQQDAPDHLVAKLYPRIGRHSWPQESVSILDHQIHAVSRLLVLIKLALAADLRDRAVKSMVGIRANLMS